MLGKLLAQLGGAMGQSIPPGCQDWANAYLPCQLRQKEGRFRMSRRDSFSSSVLRV